MSEKRESILQCETSFLSRRLEFRTKVGWLDFCLSLRSLELSIKDFIEEVSDTHRSKLQRIGIFNELNPCNPDSVIFNFSSVQVPANIRRLLSFGLDFCLPVYKLDFYKYFLKFEKLAYILSKEDVCGNRTEFLNQFQTVCFK